MKSQDLLRGMNLTRKSFTSAVHIVRGVRLEDKTRAAWLGIQTTFGYIFSEFTLVLTWAIIYKSISVPTHTQALSRRIINYTVRNYYALLLSVVVPRLLICKRSLVEKAKR